MRELWIALMLLASFAAIFADVCYPEYSKDHTGCKKPDPKCKRHKYGVSEADKKKILQLHNDMRTRLAKGEINKLPTAANMKQLQWDDELAKIAQHFTDQCVFAHDCSECRRIKRYEFVGQNLYTSMWSRDKGEANWSEAMNAFLNEYKYFKESNIKPFKADKQYGHFSQLMWANTSLVGCGFTKFKGKQYEYQYLYACNYAEGGNLVNDAMYEKGKPCSKCDNGCANGSLCK